VLCVFIENAQAWPSGLCDASLNPLEPLYAEELIRVQPDHSVGNLFIKLMLEGFIPLQGVYLHFREDESTLHVCDAFMLLLIHDIFKDVLFQCIESQHGDVKGCRMVSLVCKSMRVCERRTL
jgi:hypothetical protein